MKPLRIAVVGGGRGSVYANSAAALSGIAHLEMVCDPQPAVQEHWRGQGVRVAAEYSEVLADPNVDAVCIATPVKMHAQQSLDALNAGKHVLCEVTAAWTLDECRALIEAAQRTGLTYMMAENCCYYRPILMVQNMIERGAFGDLTYAQGDYIHSLPVILFGPDGELTWRGKFYRDEFCNTYPTHSLGPVCMWLGVNRGETLTSTATWRTKTRAAAEYVKRERGADDPLAEYSAWRLPDGMVTLINTRGGALIHHHLDWMSPRPFVGNRYMLQGTKAAFLWDKEAGQEPLIWLSGRSEEMSPNMPGAWEPLYKYADEFEHPMWKEHGEIALKVSGMGDDYMTLRDFALAIHEKRTPMLDVFDAVTWSAISPLSRQSLEQGSAPVEVPSWLQRIP